RVKVVARHLVRFAEVTCSPSRYIDETGPVIHYLSTERDLVPADARPPGGESLLALGDPAFNASPPAPVASGASFRGTRSGCLDFQSMRFDSLPDSLKEVDEGVTLLNQAHRVAESRS